MTCNDSGYQAIIHISHVTEDCIGCTSCASVCPLINYIKMIPWITTFEMKRGLMKQKPDEKTSSPGFKNE